MIWLFTLIIGGIAIAAFIDDQRKKVKVNDLQREIDAENKAASFKPRKRKR